MKQYKMWIDGKWVDAESGKTYPVFNPATEEIIAQLPFGGKADVDKAVEAARRAFPIWSKKPQAERSLIAMKIAALIRENAKELGRIDTLDHGTPTKSAAPMVAGKALNFEWAAYNSRSLMGHTVPQSPDELVYLQH
jgi:acyl-CoA reductase-like NAD-dependent aldehyde dehydrogenase